MVAQTAHFSVGIVVPLVKYSELTDRVTSSETQVGAQAPGSWPRVSSHRTSADESWADLYIRLLGLVFDVQYIRREFEPQLREAIAYVGVGPGIRIERRYRGSLATENSSPPTGADNPITAHFRPQAKIVSLRSTLLRGKVRGIKVALRDRFRDVPPPEKSWWTRRF